jgi:hypothetical protein
MTEPSVRMFEVVNLTEGASAAIAFLRNVIDGKKITTSEQMKAAKILIDAWFRQQELYKSMWSQGTPQYFPPIIGPSHGK